MHIKNSVAFVTGANRGLGLAFAQELVARGASKVYAGVRNPEGVDIPGVTAIRLDVSDPASVAAAVAQAGDVTLVVNNAGIARVLPSMLAPGLVDMAREIFETNYYGVMHVSLAFAPVLKANGGGAIVNVLSDAAWIASPLLSAYSASKSAAWSFTNSLRRELEAQGTSVQGLHVGFIDTDLTQGFDVPKVQPSEVARQSLDGVEAGKKEVLADQGTRALKAGLSDEHAPYLAPAASA
ncbi:short-chain dehydrogenase [Massilia sp. Root351]|jgi:NAD(P)-dependent dehydrogenase (short-subunit alcohol dehydrogenase family)|uniref:SDR family oxidoreductase n=1 Tax=Massilia sp. Root351 TaxID=1736522 RepID=UPI00070DB28F|nr:SDR family oxidoreductase [Massilia sp. Root351]KQV85377.1 short-chain dehydrogenase [Massilia sp. Root351]